MSKIETFVEIETPPENVWNHLINFEDYPNWNPFIRSVERDQKSENHLYVTIQVPGYKSMKLHPEIVTFLRNSELRWKGKLFIKGIFDGEHYFIIENSGINRTRFIHGEVFSGLLPPLMKSMLTKTEEGFRQMNMALKEKCEANFRS